MQVGAEPPAGTDGDRRRRPQFQHPAGGQSPESTLTVFAGSTPALVPPSRLRSRQHNNGDDHLIAGFDDLSRTWSADMDDRFAHGLEERLGPLRNLALSPPIMMLNVPAMAPLSPPLAGASQRVGTAFL